ncbi:TetR/AcrR family transcriptional regulator [Subtercola frigoramans]|uniref:AcrR family transcriptional regulator n=1 Tax=Subtercola frigoramans TaxID=120298 RepID=A0ABS2LA06_9MICO|nr:TetR/AcrR family transcriptional regulator [Subtercola frigoramans]MBM7473706.1 AcrR family transcriptional regulator [Subtercola frigoramans]
MSVANEATDEATAAMVPKGRLRGSYAKTEATRSAILDSALEVFALGGYRSGSLRDIAVRVGMSEAGLLHHFSSKSRLLEAVLERRDAMADQFVPRQSIDGPTSVRGLVALARYNASTPGVVELYCTLSAEATSPDHPAHDYFVRRYVVTRNLLAEAFADLGTKGLLKDGVDPARAASSTIALMDGLQVQWLLDRTVLDMADELRVHLTNITTLEL